MSDYLAEIDKSGFAGLPGFINKKQIEKLIKFSLELAKFSSSRKSKSIYGVRNLLHISSEINELAESRKVKSVIGKILGRKAKPVRAIFFDKTPDVNWKVPWHQDLTISVKEKRETDGFTAWTS